MVSLSCKNPSATQVSNKQFEYFEAMSVAMQALCKLWGKIGDEKQLVFQTGLEDSRGGRRGDMFR